MKLSDLVRIAHFEKGLRSKRRFINYIGPPGNIWLQFTFIKILWDNKFNPHFGYLFYLPIYNAGGWRFSREKDKFKYKTYLGIQGYLALRRLLWTSSNHLYRCTYAYFWRNNTLEVEIPLLIMANLHRPSTIRTEALYQPIIWRGLSLRLF